VPVTIRMSASIGVFDETIVDDVDDSVQGEGSSNNNNNNNNHATTWNGPPTPPDPDLILHDISCQGSIAIALQEALEEFQQHELMQAFQEKTNHIPFDIQNVMQTYAESIVHCQQKQYQSQMNHITTQQQQQQQKQQSRRNKSRNVTDSLGTSTITSIEDHVVAPAALLHGRIHHYNRYGTKWRIVVEDAEIIPRSTVSVHQKRGRYDRKSPWEIMSSHTELQQAQCIKIPRLEILVYNDIE
jgi:hypothetical protein